MSNTKKVILGIIAVALGICAIGMVKSKSEEKQSQAATIE